MLKKSDITGFEKEYLWVDQSTNSIYQFFSDETGIMVDGNDNQKEIKWEYVDDKNAIKIALDGQIFYYVFKDKGINNLYSVIFKSRDKTNNTTLSKVAKQNEVKETKEESNENTELAKEKFQFSKLETSDKVFMSALIILTTIILTIVLKMAVFFSGLSLITAFLLASLASLAIFVYLRDIIYFFSKKYKKEIEDIIFKK